jgi:alpha-D-ribose 1-methylphosphonate 5-triphosphate synthase subunit PhnI
MENCARYMAFIASLSALSPVSTGRLRYIDRRISAFFADLSDTIPIGEMQFDTVIARDVVVHVLDTNMLYSEVHRVLRRAAISLWAHRSSMG